MILNLLMPVIEERTFVSLQMMFVPGQDTRELRAEREHRDLLIV